MAQVSDEPRDARQLLLRIAEMRGRRCRSCEAELCGHALLFDIVAGFQGDPTCPECVAQALGRPVDFVTARVRDYIHHRDCTRTAWKEISRSEPDCPLARGSAAGTRAEPAASAAGTRASLVEPGALAVADTWDAGDLGCGDLVLELRSRMRRLSPHQVLHLVARDPGAPADIPAWCALTGHQLLTARHPDYHIRRKDD